ncbi:MAG: glycosyltransferase family 2 protein [Ignavibacteriota bacterium]
MIDETQTSPNDAMDEQLRESNSSEENSSGGNPAPRRDIIAERMAQRIKDRPAPPPEEPAGEIPTIIEPPKLERKVIELIPKESPNEQAKPATETPSPIISDALAQSTDSLEVTLPTSVDGSKERGERPQRDRGRNRERVERRQPREPRPERTSDVTAQQPRPQTPRPPRPERPERKETAEPTQREARTPVAKTSENAFSRARGLASKLGVSVVIPLYNEQDSLRELTAALREELFKLCEKNYEIIYINDGSTDRSADILKDIVAGTSKVSTLSFRTNQGKSAGLSVGFKEAKYGIIITMDADLQDDPKELTNLIAKLDEGFDLVSGWKKKRHDPISKTAPSKLFNAVTSFFSGIKLHDFNCGLKAYRKQVIDSLDVYGELHRYLPALAHWSGFRVTEIPVTHHPRRFGKSKFGSSRFFKGFLDLLSIVFTNRYGKRPLHLFGTIGTVMSLIGLAINIYVSIEWAKGLTTLSNRPILLLGILLMMLGVQLISTGLLGEMIVKNNAKAHDVPFIKDKRKPRPPRPGEERGARPERTDRGDRPERRRGPERNRP